MSDPLMLYTAYTWLAYRINETYYQQRHYVWCTPYFDPASKFAPESAVPPTSSPREIYNNLFDEVARGDRHSAKISQNRLGIIRGADVKRKLGIIGDQAHADITAIATSAEVRDFRPLLFVIPFALVSGAVKQVPVKDRAHPLSQEFIIENLGRASFDVWELR